MSIFLQAIDLHADWKARLAKIIQEEGFIDPKLVQDDHQCPLGQWIDHEGLTFQHSPFFAAMCQRHTEFHRIVGEITSLNNIGALKLAAEYFSRDGAIEQASQSLIEVLQRCHDEFRRSDPG